MQQAIEKARDGVAKGQSPFGCAIAQNDSLLAVEHNTVLATTDITAHAEVNALRSGCRAAGSIFLSDCIVATTCEPCPMCMAALHWARVREVYFGATIEDAAAAGFNELTVPAAEMLTIGGSDVVIRSGIQRDACRSLFDEWLERPDRVVY